MRLIGIIAIVVGVFMATVYSPDKADNFGDVLDSGTVYFRSQAQFKPIEVTLSVDNNPIKITLYGYFLPGGAYMDNAIPMEVSLRQANRTIRSEKLTFSAKDQANEPAVKPRKDGSEESGTVLLSQSTLPFVIDQSGTYQVVVRSPQPVDFSLSLLDAVIHEKVSQSSPDLKIPGVALALFGAIILFRERKKSRKRRRKKNRKSKRDSAKNEIENRGEKTVEKERSDPPPKPKKQRHRWGRQKKPDS